ncbi:LysR substrate-binding domain-containing protein [Streptomyces sp. NPDC051740]|uniref:LysR substrate-binding domain-containing protein n=1 Tax=Streptomyces sp. NPDC051740 TaxID=3365673 RepID=UPI00379EE41C
MAGAARVGTACAARCCAAAGGRCRPEARPGLGRPGAGHSGPPAHGAPARPAPRSPAPSARSTRSWRRAASPSPTAPAVTVPSLYAVLSAVNAGAGASVRPRSLCREYLGSGRLTPLHAPEEPPLNTLLLVQRPGSEANPDVFRVRDTLRRAARNW